ncbi:MAG TPA: hypothetical protein VGP72_31775 [Planctomycetota bacterium]
MAVERAARETIDGIVAEWVQLGRMFTAFEVSLAAKGKGVRQRHRELKGYVHQSTARQAGARYTRTLRDVGAPVQAWLYHPLNANPYTYRPLDRSDFDTAPVSAASCNGGPALRNPLPLSSALDGDGDPGDDVCGTDSQGHLVIPARLLTALGVEAETQVYLTWDAQNAELRISRAGVASRGHSAVAATNKDGSLSIPQETLKRAELDGMQSYSIEGTGNMISVRENKLG